MQIRMLPLGALSLVLLAACSGKVTEKQVGAAQVVEDTGAIAFVDAAQDSFPRIRFADGRISLNDRCPVRQVRLNRRMPPIYVNGQPVGFC